MRDTIQLMASEISEKALQIGLDADELPEDVRCGTVTVELKNALIALDRAKVAMGRCLARARIAGTR